MRPLVILAETDLGTIIYTRPGIFTGTPVGNKCRLIVI